MKKYWRLISLSALLFVALLTLSACGTSIAKKDVLTEDMRSQRIGELKQIPAYLGWKISGQES